MYELIKLSENDYYIDCPSKIGIVKVNEDEVFLIDSGNDKDAGKKAFRILEENGWKLKAIINTHSHADHIGGNALLQNRTGCKIYAKGIECDYTNNPILEPAYLYGGLPFSDIKNKFFFAQKSEALPLEKAELPNGFEIIDLPGHSFEMVGIKTPDGNFFAADSVASKDTLSKYQITYLYDVKAYLETLEKLKTLNVKKYIPSHTEVVEDITEFADFNRKVIFDIENLLISFLDTPQSLEEIMQKVFTHFGIKINMMQYTLLTCTIRSYISGLSEAGRIEYFFEENILKWKAK